MNVYSTNSIIVRISYFLKVLVLNTVSHAWECAWYADEVMHSKTRRCKLRIWLFPVRDGVEMHVHTIFTWLVFVRVFCTGYFVRTYTFRMKPPESLIHETPGHGSMPDFRVTHTALWGPLLVLRCNSSLLWGTGSFADCSSEGSSSENNLETLKKDGSLFIVSILLL